MRAQEDHLSPQELASLPDAPERLTAELAQHLEACSECRSLAETEWMLRQLGRARAMSVPAAECPEPGDWLDLVEGLKPEDEAQVMLRHAAECKQCAERLRVAMDVLQPMEPGELTEPMAGLASSTPEWQQRMAAEMAAASRKQEAAPVKVMEMPRRKVAWKPWAVAASVVVAGALVGAAVWQRMHPADARLLAMAYNKQRTLELRVPGGEPVAMASETRGEATPGSDLHGLTDTSELLELRLRARQHLDETPNSPYWHQVMGEVNLLERDGVAARRNFEIAQTTDEHLPNLEADLAAAWFEIAEKTGNAESYAQAAELYLRQLHQPGMDKRPEEAALLHYNLAQCWERQSLMENALDDLREALKLERDPAWRKAMEAELDRLQNHAATTPTDGYEEALDEATTKWLPLWGTSAEAREKIAATAQLGLKHHDRWLLDWMKAGHTKLSEEGDQHLAAAAASGGVPARSLGEAQASAVAYRRSGNAPGTLRAQLAEAYALQRLVRSAECLRESVQILHAPGASSYMWLHTQAILEQGSCQWQLGDTDGAARTLEVGIQGSFAASLPMMRARAQGLGAGMLGSRGMNAAAWAMDVEGLRDCRQAGCPPIRVYQFLYDLVNGAQRLNYSEAAPEVMRTAAAVSGRTGDQTLHAYALEKYSRLLGLTGHSSQADEVFQLAVKAAPSGSAYADWQIDRAEVLAATGETQRALNVLANDTTLVAGYDFGRIRYLARLASTQLAVGKLTDAIGNAEMAVRLIEKSLLQIAPGPERERMERENALAYGTLVSCYLKEDDPQAGFAAWERFRRSPYDHPASDSPHLTSVEVSGTPHEVLAVARVGDQYVGWLTSGSPAHVIRFERLGKVQRVDAFATILYRLCSDPESSIQDIRTAGSALYDELIRPFAASASLSGELWLDVDQALSEVPFAALTRSGHWLGEDYRIVLLEPWWTLGDGLPRLPARVSAGDRLLAVDGFEGDRNTLTGGASEIAGIKPMFPHSVVLNGASGGMDEMGREMERADVFLFSGHASSAGKPRLLLSGSASSPVIEAATIQRLNLRRCKLAVLAACNTSATGRDRGETAMDLKDAMLLAGAHAVVASSWDVDDRGTRDFMGSFFRFSLSSSSAAESLQATQQWMRTREAEQHPFYWASFELYST